MGFSAVQMRMLLTCFCLMLCFCVAGISQSKEPAIIEGTIYDPTEAVFIDMTVSVQNVFTGEVITTKTDSQGRYAVKISAGRYRVAMHPKVGIQGYTHSAFYLAWGEKVLINFRPKSFLSIVSGFTDRKYISQIGGSLPSQIIHFVIPPKLLSVKELHIEFGEERKNGAIYIYESVTASFERFSLSAALCTFDLTKKKVIATGNVIFEDGQTVHKINRVEIDLVTDKFIVNSTGKQQR